MVLQAGIWNKVGTGKVQNRVLLVPQRKTIESGCNRKVSAASGPLRGQRLKTADWSWVGYITSIGAQILSFNKGVKSRRPQYYRICAGIRRSTLIVTAIIQQDFGTLGHKVMHDYSRISSWQDWKGRTLEWRSLCHALYFKKFTGT